MVEKLSNIPWKAEVQKWVGNDKTSVKKGGKWEIGKFSRFGNTMVRVP